MKDNDWTKGIHNIKSQFLKLLEDAGLKLLDGKGHQANPNHHEIVTAVPGAPENEIIEVLEQGYSFNDKLIKPSKVVVGNE
jgi:molecular chaperone GrpE